MRREDDITWQLLQGITPGLWHSEAMAELERLKAVSQQ